MTKPLKTWELDELLNTLDSLSRVYDRMYSSPGFTESAVDLALAPVKINICSVMNSITAVIEEKLKE